MQYLIEIIVKCKTALHYWISKLFSLVICCVQNPKLISQPIHIFLRGSSEDKDEWALWEGFKYQFWGQWPRIPRICLCCDFIICISFPITIILVILQLKYEERWRVFDNFTSLEVEHGTGWTDACTKPLFLFIPIREHYMHSMGRRCSLYLLRDWLFVTLQEPFW